MKNNNFEDEILNKEHDGAKYPHLKKLYNADFYTLDFDPYITRYDDDVLDDDYEDAKYSPKMWRDTHPQ
ncbi:hypothetical protein [Lutispora sp.]|uniref:hypothetical protein n=1 Tax=Lutispora sp. TaxID=2828727 RepID=UPI002B1F94B9|nr:hypothetical protein [Lutispora sp.]MEA4961516.1 hypothetical protein [Lutispora sp.]